MIVCSLYRQVYLHVKGEGVPENEAERGACSLPALGLSGASAALLLNLFISLSHSSAFPQKTPSDIFRCPRG